MATEASFGASENETFVVLDNQQHSSADSNASSGAQPTSLTDSASSALRAASLAARLAPSAETVSSTSHALHTASSPAQLAATTVVRRRAVRHEELKAKVEHTVFVGIDQRVGQEIDIYGILYITNYRLRFVPAVTERAVSAFRRGVFCLKML